MKKSLHTFIFLLPFLLFSCVSIDSEPLWPEPDPTGTRGILEISLQNSTEEDAEKIHTVRMIIFNQASTVPVMDFNEVTTMSDVQADRFTVHAQTHIDDDKMVVIIANEPEGLTSALNAVTTLPALENMEYHLGQMLNENPYTLRETGMPMTGVLRNVEVGQHNVTYPASYGMTIERAVARLDFYLESGVNTRTGYTGGETRVTLNNSYDRGYLVMGNVGNGTRDNTSDASMNFGREVPVVSAGDLADVESQWKSWLATETLSVSYDEGEDNSFFVCSFYTAERRIGEEDQRLSLTLEGIIRNDGVLPTNTYMLEELVAEGGSSPVPFEEIRRNSVYRIVGIVTEQGPNFLVTMTDWEDVPIEVNMSTTEYIKILPSGDDFYWWLGGQTRMRIETTHGGSWKVESLTPWLTFLEGSLEVTELWRADSEIIELKIAAGVEHLPEWVDEGNDVLRDYGRIRLTTDGGRVKTTAVVVKRKPIAPLFARSNVAMYQHVEQQIATRATVSSDGGNQFPSDGDYMYQLLTFAETEEDQTTGKSVKQNAWYWNGNPKGERTFEFKISEWGDNDYFLSANLMGVQFRWGSLMPWGHGGVWDEVIYSTCLGEQTTFIPYEYTGDLNWFWSSDYPAWRNESILYVNDRQDAFANYSARGYDAVAGKGDVCRYISDKGWVQGKWRTPTQIEWAALILETPVRTETGTPVSTKYTKLIGTEGLSNSSDYEILNDLSEYEWTDHYGFYRMDAGRLLGAGVLGDDDLNDHRKSPGTNRVFLPAGGYGLEYDYMYTEQDAVRSFVTRGSTYCKEEALLNYVGFRGLYASSTPTGDKAGCFVLRINDPASGGSTHGTVTPDAVLPVEDDYKATTNNGQEDITCPTTTATTTVRCIRIH